ncbi:TRM11 family SAM-dependent methyltransferase [Phaeacidiphilus oryzae]|uniref:TRM11 family SAM-dependent methyltransferase n=1 Tax=Phaeacidiphilus oryzae TaxID=348818 RepID=UPI00055ED545|nr:restriction endonuclease subunit M [Phaeacidiphilus oryzae]
MTDYAFLVRPSHNRVYSQAALALVQAELGVFNERALGGRLTGVGTAELGGVPYVTFSTDGEGELTEGELRLLANLSSLYALFAYDREAGTLRPVTARPLDLFSSDLLTIQKYSGKTNEDFTKLLLNVTAMATDRPQALLDRALRVLDPMCGRGTTLNQALMYGLDSAGMDVDAQDFDAYALFLRTWLKHSRLKHQAESGPIRRNKRTLGRRFQASIGADKERYKRGEVIGLEVVNADTLQAREFFRPSSFDLVVTDAPYGVQHGSRPGGGGQGGGQGGPRLDRSPTALLRAAVPVWTELLRPGGAIGISWNTHVAGREELAGVLAEAGLEVRDSEAYRGFEHRVDQSIVRDLVVARKP